MEGTRFAVLAGVRAHLIGLLLVAACTGGNAGDDDDDGGGGGFVGLWQYQQDSFSFVNCFTTSRNVDLTRTGFQIVDEAGTLIRINPDGCRFTIVLSTVRHASGVEGEQCTVNGDDGFGNPLTTLYTLESLVMEIDPGEGVEMNEVFFLDALQTTSLGTVHCEISGSNTLDRAP